MRFSLINKDCRKSDEIEYFVTCSSGKSLCCDMLLLFKSLKCLKIYTFPTVSNKPDDDRSYTSKFMGRTIGLFGERKQKSQNSKIISSLSRIIIH